DVFPCQQINHQSGIVALLFSVVYLLAGEHIIALLTSLTQIQQLADRYLIWQVILPLVGVWCYLLDGMFIGATRAAEMRNSMAVAPQLIRNSGILG
ncbi:hypothetical protein AAIH07_35310, partial [Pseudomonas aeruginosa]